MSEIHLDFDERELAAKTVYETLFADEPDRKMIEGDMMIGRKIIDHVIRAVNKQRECSSCHFWWNPKEISERWPSVWVCIQCWDEIQEANTADAEEVPKTPVIPANCGGADYHDPSRAWK